MNLKKVSCSLGALGWSLLLLQLLVQLTSAQNSTCPYECIPLTQCPELAKLLNYATSEKVRVLMNATCSVEPKVPTVCCPELATTPTTSLEPTTTPKTSLEPTTTPQTSPEPTTTPLTSLEPTATPPTNPESTETPSTSQESTETPPTSPESTETPLTSQESTETPPTSPEPTIIHPTSLLPEKCGMGPELDRIFGGTEAPLNAYPWMAVFGYTSRKSSSLQFACGGAVINERYILTAAHCVDPSLLKGASLRVIRLGEWDLRTRIDCEVTLLGFKTCAPPAKDFTYEEIIMHPDYNVRTNYSDDIALIRLSRPIDLSGKSIQPICLPPQNMDIQTAMGVREAVVAGWGFTEKGPGSNRLLNVFLPMFDMKTCNDTRNGRLVDEQVCFGGRPGEDSCKGDSGGPLMVSGPHGPPFQQIGVVSYGASLCGSSNIAGVYTSVSHYRNWIEENMRP